MQSLILQIKQLIEEINPEYTFVFETERMMNVRADDIKFPVAFWNEYPTATNEITKTRYGQMVLRERVELSFMRNAPRDNYHCNAVEREELRQQIMDEIVEPFIKAIGSVEGFREINDWTIAKEPPMFDDVEVSVLVSFYVERSIC